MLGWALIFCILAIVAGALGLWGVTSTADAIARLLLFVFLLLLLLVSALVRALRDRRPI